MQVSRVGGKAAGLAKERGCQEVGYIASGSHGLLARATTSMMIVVCYFINEFFLNVKSKAQQ